MYKFLFIDEILIHKKYTTLRSLPYVYAIWINHTLQKVQCEHKKETTLSCNYYLFLLFLSSNLATSLYVRSLLQLHHKFRKIIKHWTFYHYHIVNLSFPFVEHDARMKLSSYIRVKNFGIHPKLAKHYYKSMIFTLVVSWLQWL